MVESKLGDEPVLEGVKRSLDASLTLRRIGKYYLYAQFATGALYLGEVTALRSTEDARFVHIQSFKHTFSSDEIV